MILHIGLLGERLMEVIEKVYEDYNVEAYFVFGDQKDEDD